LPGDEGGDGIGRVGEDQPVRREEEVTGLFVQVFDSLAVVFIEIFVCRIGAGFCLVCRVQQWVKRVFVALQDIGKGEAVVAFVKDA